MGIDPRKEENKRLMVMAGGAGEGGKGWKQGKKDCFVCMQGCRVGHKENVGLGGKTILGTKYRTDKENI